MGAVPSGASTFSPLPPRNLTVHARSSRLARASPEVLSELEATFPKGHANRLARLFRLGGVGPDEGVGLVLVISAGTSDLPVAEEAVETARAMGTHVKTLYDVGVAGLHRLLAHRSLIETARVAVVAAGMEGALASVVGGLIDRPVIAVPTSIGYGASFGGISALLAMLNSCAANVAVVNIDNGFGAAYVASVINRLAEPASADPQPELGEGRLEA